VQFPNLIAYITINCQFDHLRKQYSLINDQDWHKSFAFAHAEHMC